MTARNDTPFNTDLQDRRTLSVGLQHGKRYLYLSDLVYNDV